jgi:hypothetical protein
VKFLLVSPFFRRDHREDDVDLSQVFLPLSPSQPNRKVYRLLNSYDETLLGRNYPKSSYNLQIMMCAVIPLSFLYFAFPRDDAFLETPEKKGIVCMETR